jgi:DNA polymerase III subunit delta
LKVQLRALARHLAAGLAPVYVVPGDEPLLVADALDAIRAAARREGFDTRDLHVTDRSFRWDELLSDADNLSLFARRRILEIRMPSPRPGDAGARVLRELAAARDPDRLLIVAIAARLDSAATSSQWMKALEGAGVLVEIRAIERGELSQWVRDRAARYSLKVTPAAAQLLADRVEGHLLAADQELMKLALIGDGEAVDEARVLESVADSARFDVFRLTDAVLERDAPRAFRVLAGLRAEGVEPVLVSWALGRELGLLTALKFAATSGQRLDGVFARHRVWPKRRTLLERALRRFDSKRLAALLAQAVELDAIVKGAPGLQPWDAVTRLVVSMLDADPRSTRAA